MDFKIWVLEDFPEIEKLVDFNIIPEQSFIIYAVKVEFEKLKLQGCRPKESYEILAASFCKSPECIQQWILYNPIKIKDH